MAVPTLASVKKLTEDNFIMVLTAFQLGDGCLIVAERAGLLKVVLPVLQTVRESPPDLLLKTLA